MKTSRPSFNTVRAALGRAYFHSTLAETLGALPADERAALTRALDAARRTFPEDATLVALLAILSASTERH